jgi:hypothetical protein
LDRQPVRAGTRAPLWSQYVEHSDFLAVHAQALMDLTEILLLAGQPRAATPILNEATRLWEQKGNLVAAARTRRVRAPASAR